MNFFPSKVGKHLQRMRCLVGAGKGRVYQLLCLPALLLLLCSILNCSSLSDFSALKNLLWEKREMAPCVIFSLALKPIEFRLHLV